MACLLSGFVEKRLNTQEVNKPQIAIQRVNRKLISLVQNKENVAFTIGKKLKQYRISVIDCQGIWDKEHSLCIVPCFNHNYSCKCKNPEPNGVLRLFGVEVTVDGYPHLDDLMGIWEIDKDTHLIISVMTCSEEYVRVFNPLKLLSDF